ncbi:hypothetical protein CR513_37626, partial [Mucuna pruriens]
MQRISRNYALKPLCRELHGVAGILTHACDETSAICSFCIPALQKFAKDLMQSQSSTSGCPEGLTLLSTSGPFSMPNKTAAFLEEPTGALRNCQCSEEEAKKIEYIKEK